MLLREKKISGKLPKYQDVGAGRDFINYFLPPLIYREIKVQK